MAFVTVLETTRAKATTPFFGGDLAPGAKSAARAAIDRLNEARKAAGCVTTEEISKDNLVRSVSIDYGTRDKYNAFVAANEADLQTVREARGKYFTANGITATFTMPA